MSRSFSVVVLVAVAMSGCGGSRPVPTTSAPGRLGTPDDVISAMAPVPGGLLYAERTSGRIMRTGADGRDPRTVLTVGVSHEGQRGLLGLARGRRGELYAAWTDPSHRLVVGEVAPQRRIIWDGPATPTLGVGGRIAFAPDGRLVIGVGDLEQHGRIDDPSVPNGKLLALDPTGPATQTPEILSSGWTNPFAFTFTPDGDLWVADNAIGNASERLARGDEGMPTHVTELPRGTAPSGLAAVSDHELLLCGYVSRELVGYRITTGGRAMRDGTPIARDCALGVVSLGGGRIAYARPDAPVVRSLAG